MQCVEVTFIGKGVDEMDRRIANVQAWLLTSLDYESFLACWWRGPRFDPGSLSWETSYKNGYFSRDLFSKAPYFKSTRTEKMLRYCGKLHVAWRTSAILTLTININSNISRQNPMAGWIPGRTVVCSGGLALASSKMPTKLLSCSCSSTGREKTEWKKLTGRDKDRRIAYQLLLQA